jgi:hypothetical protein
LAGSEPIYVPVGEPDREAFLRAFRADDGNAVAEQLIALAFHDPDWRWVQERCLQLVTHEDPHRRYIGVLCLEYILRTRGELEFERVLPTLGGLAHDDDQSVRDAVASFRACYREFEPIVDYLPLPEPDLDSFESCQERNDLWGVRRQLLALAGDERLSTWVTNRCLELLSGTDLESQRIAVVALRGVVHPDTRFDARSVLPALRRYRARVGATRELDDLAEDLSLPVGVEGYSPWRVPSRDALTAAHEKGDTLGVTTHLAGLALEDPSWRWVQDVCLRLVHDRDPRVRVAAVTSLGNLLHFRGQLDRDEVVQVLRDVESDEALADPLRDFFLELDASPDAD